MCALHVTATTYYTNFAENIVLKDSQMILMFEQFIPNDEYI
jgi:hypothetical protein